LGELFGIAVENIKNNDILQTSVKTVTQIIMSLEKKTNNYT